MKICATKMYHTALNNCIRISHTSHPICLQPLAMPYTKGLMSCLELSKFGKAGIVN